MLFKTTVSIDVFAQLTVSKTEGKNGSIGPLRRFTPVMMNKLLESTDCSSDFFMQYRKPVFPCLIEILIIRLLEFWINKCVCVPVGCLSFTRIML